MPRKNQIFHVFFCMNILLINSTTSYFIFSMNITDLTEKEGSRSRGDSSCGTLGMDEGFCLIDEIPGSGITVGFLMIAR